MRSTLNIALASLAALLFASDVRAQLADLQPGRNFTAIATFGTGKSENGDFGDADLDGDLDCITANGGDGSVAQLARIFINNGSGTFADQTSTRFAGFIAMQSRDCEFMDVENDGDLDVYIANKNAGGGSTGFISRFFINNGGVQAGSVGFYTDETDTRWGTLASVPASDQVCGGCNSGPWRDWSCDCDFGDIDDDGHIDLFHSSYGPAIDGTRRSRIFLNDDNGVFNELFPWVNAGADIQTHTIDFDLADFDGDFDLDVFMASRNSQARVYMNNLYNGISASPFNDITQVALIAQGSTQTGAANYEGEYADVDGDGDFDVWLKNFNGNLDRLQRNDGPVAGGFKFTQVNSWISNDPNNDENEVDFGDYDNDGDLDSFVANFSSTNFLYASNLAQGGQGGGLYHRTGVATGQYPNPELPSNFNGGTSLDGDWGDLDNDGDLDIGLFNDANQGNWLFRNILGVPDTHAPAFYQVTVQGDKANGTETVIHAQIRDNGPGEWLTNYFDWDLVYTVDGGSPITVPMLGQFGSQARGVIPAQTDASVEYHVEVTDLAGNTGVSGATTFFQGGGSDPWTDLGGGLAGINGIPVLVGTGPLTTGSAGTLSLTNAAPSATASLFISLASTPAPFKCGTLVPVPIAFQFLLFTNGSGALPLAWGSWPNGLSGQSVYFQHAIADAAAVCGVSISNAVRGDVP
jgi:hypothetical protein